MKFVSILNAYIKVYVYFNHLILMVILLIYSSLLLVYLCKIMAMQLSRIGMEAKYN
jgi:hypothetical protein